MSKINLNLGNITKYTESKKFTTLLNSAKKAHLQLQKESKDNHPYLGWITLPTNTEIDEIKRIKEVASDIRVNSELVIIIGIGGSYLGAKAIIGSLASKFGAINKAPRKDPIIIYAGYNMCGDYANEIKELIKQYETSVIVISKSGMTLEPAISFRFIKEEMVKKYGKNQSQSRIITITDGNKGALKELSVVENYISFEIPSNIGGRFSVLTSVGLLPAAIAGFDIQLIIDGAIEMQEICKKQGSIAEQYAATRNLLYSNKMKIEILASFNSQLECFFKWWEQLFAESEGKGRKSIFPTSAIYSTDLHSIGQLIQDGEKNIFETFIKIKQSKSDMNVKMTIDNIDQLNFIAGMKYSEINDIAEKATIIANMDGDTPCIEISMERLDEINIGALIYFFEYSCAISGYIKKINPFDQPGVSAYKYNMSELLKKEGKIR